MGVGKGYARPDDWPPVSSIVVTGDRWYVVHLTRAVELDSFDGSRTGHALPVYALKDARVFRAGRSDYSNAWHQTLPWMEKIR